MPDRTSLFRRFPHLMLLQRIRSGFFSALCLLFVMATVGCAHLPPPQSSSSVATTPPPRPFRYETDRFAFANETVWNYVGGEIRPESERADQDKPRYERHCFVVARAALQFWKFARFEPLGQPLPSDQLADRIRDVTSRSVWNPPLAEEDRIVFPGYRNLYGLSAAFSGVFEANLGLGWPTYFRLGNMPMIFPTGHSAETRFNQEIWHDLQAGYPTILWLYNFPSLNMNHAVLVFAGVKRGDRFVYRVYDPNYADAPKRLEFDPQQRRFFYESTFYFKGGPVTARPIYRSPFQ